MGRAAAPPSSFAIFPRRCREVKPLTAENGRREPAMHVVDQQQRRQPFDVRWPQVAVLAMAGGDLPERRFLMRAEQRIHAARHLDLLSSAGKSRRRPVFDKGV